MATQLKVLPPGSVQFDDIGSDTLEGVIKKPLIRSFTHGHAKEVRKVEVCVCGGGTRGVEVCVHVCVCGGVCMGGGVEVVAKRTQLL